MEYYQDKYITKNTITHYLMCVSRALLICQAFEANVTGPFCVVKALNRDDRTNWLCSSEEKKKKLKSFLLGGRIKFINEKYISKFPDWKEKKEIFTEAKDSRNYIAHESCLCTKQQLGMLNQNFLGLFLLPDPILQENFSTLKDHVHKVALANYSIVEIFYSHIEPLNALLKQYTEHEYQEQIIDWTFSDSFKIKSPKIYLF